MQISPANNLNFKSNILILSPKEYEDVVGEMETHAEYKNICNWDILPKEKDEFYSAYRTNSSLISSEDVRSCTLLHLVEEGETSPFTMHAYDSKENIKYLSKIKSHIKGSNAFIMGSKKQFKYSPILFDKTEKMINRKKIPATIFKNLSIFWQASMAYNAKQNTIFLTISEIMDPLNYVKNFQDLKKVFSKIQISPKDTVHFLCKR